MFVGDNAHWNSIKSMMELCLSDCYMHNLHWKADDNPLIVSAKRKMKTAEMIWKIAKSSYEMHIL